MSSLLEPTARLYCFTVDGINIADPNNPMLRLRVRTSRTSSRKRRRSFALHMEPS
jgi:hypothetical protein